MPAAFYLPPADPACPACLPVLPAYYAALQVSCLNGGRGAQRWTNLEGERLAYRAARAGYARRAGVCGVLGGARGAAEGQPWCCCARQRKALRTWRARRVERRHGRLPRRKRHFAAATCTVGRSCGTARRGGKAYICLLYNHGERAGDATFVLGQAQGCAAGICGVLRTDLRWCVTRGASLAASLVPRCFQHFLRMLVSCLALRRARLYGDVSVAARLRASSSSLRAAAMAYLGVHGVSYKGGRCSGALPALRAASPAAR